MILLNFILSPIGKLMAMTLVVLAALGFIYGKGQYDGRKNLKDAITRESTKTVSKAIDARDSAVRRYDGGLHNDGFRRD